MTEGLLARALYKVDWAVKNEAQCILLPGEAEVVLQFISEMRKDLAEIRAEDDRSVRKTKGMMPK